MGFDSHYSIDMGDAFKRTLWHRAHGWVSCKELLCALLWEEIL